MEPQAETTASEPNYKQLLRVCPEQEQEERTGLPRQEVTRDEVPPYSSSFKEWVQPSRTFKSTLTLVKFRLHLQGRSSYLSGC